MATKDIDIFIPAAALEQPGNGEDFHLREKLCAAIRRYQQNGTFEGTITVYDPMPILKLLAFRFDRARLGYHVVGEIIE